MATLADPGTTVLSPSKLAHVVLRTNDYRRLTSFYRTFLNARVTFENDFMAFVTYDSEHHRIGIVNFADIGPKDPQTSGLEHIAFTYGSLHDLCLAYLQRKANGIEPFWCINHGPTTSVYYHDPDGNILETQVENFGTAEEAQAYMRSDAYRVNPLGVDVDMTELIGRLQEGEPEHILKVRPESGPRALDDVPSQALRG